MELFFERKVQIKDCDGGKVIEGTDVSYVHNNNAGENEAFDKLCKQKEMDVKFEYIAPSTSQKNH